MQKHAVKHKYFRYYLLLFTLHLPNKPTTKTMKTQTAKKRLIEIVDKLLEKSLIADEIKLECNLMFNKYALLDMEIDVNLKFEQIGHDENQLTYFKTESINVTKFKLIDEDCDRVLNNEQEKELVRMISQYIIDYYDNKGKRII